MRQTPRPAPGGFFTDRSPPVMSKADQKFKEIVGRYPNGVEQQMAPRDGHPLEQTVDWSEAPLAKAYPQWETFLFELHQERTAGNRTMRQMRHQLSKRRGPLLGPDGPSAADVNRKFGTCEKK